MARYQHLPIYKKGGEKREVPMNEAVKDALIKVRKNPKSPYIFCYKNGEPVRDIHKSFWTALKKSVIKDFRFDHLSGPLAHPVEHLTLKPLRRQIATFTF